MTGWESDVVESRMAEAAAAARNSTVAVLVEQTAGYSLVAEAAAAEVAAEQTFGMHAEVD